MKDKKIEKITELSVPILEEWSMFLVDIKLDGGKNSTVWIYVDAEDRDVGLDECAEVSNEIGFLIDAHEIFEQQYRLNVSTPGTDRPLTDVRQYRKNRDRKVRVKFNENGSKQSFVGRLKEVGSEEIGVDTEEGERRKIDFSDIIETKVIPEINR